MTKLEPIKAAAAHYAAFMKAAGLPLTEETRDTPMRVARMFMREFSSHLSDPPPVAVFNRRNYDQYVVVRDIGFSSICEHHHMPFFGLIHIGYHPKEKLAGLSKLPRVTQYFASRPQLQEHLVVEIADYLFKELQPHAVMVVASANHSCMSCRGIRSQGSSTVTSRILTAPGKDIDKSEVMRLMGL